MQRSPTSVSKHDWPQGLLIQPLQSPQHPRIKEFILLQSSSKVIGIRQTWTGWEKARSRCLCHHCMNAYWIKTAQVLKRVVSKQRDFSQFHQSCQSPIESCDFWSQVSHAPSLRLRQRWSSAESRRIFLLRFRQHTFLPTKIERPKRNKKRKKKRSKES